MGGGGSEGGRKDTGVVEGVSESVLSDATMHNSTVHTLCGFPFGPDSGPELF